MTLNSPKIWAYSIKLEGTISDKPKGSNELDPKQLQQLPEAMQQANECRKWLVASYNACAVTQAQYAAFGAHYQDMDDVARNINDMLRNGNGSTESSNRVSALVQQYVQLANTLQSPTSKP